MCLWGQAMQTLYCDWIARYLGRSLDPQSPEEQEEERRGFQNNGFNQFRSDRIALDREIPDTRDPRWVWFTGGGGVINLWIHSFQDEMHGQTKCFRVGILLVPTKCQSTC